MQVKGARAAPVTAFRMLYDLKAKTIVLTPALRTAVEKAMKAIDGKVGKLGKSVTGEIEIGKITSRKSKGELFRAEIHVRLPQSLVYAECQMEDLYAAIVGARKEAEAQIKKIKGMRVDKKRRAGAGKRA